MVVTAEVKNKLRKIKLAEEKLKREALSNPLFFVQNYVITIDEHDRDNPYVRDLAYDITNSIELELMRKADKLE